MTHRHTLASILTLLICVSPALAANRPPEFNHVNANQWINSPPLTLKGLQGQPVLIEFWTFDCINCRRSLPWLKAAYAKYYPQGLQVVSVHTPELPRERVAANVRQAVTELGINYPVMLDMDFSYWNAFDNRYWPAFYLLDRSGIVVEHRIGELHSGTANATSFEAAIQRVLSASR